MEFRWAIVAALGVLMFGTLQGIVVAIILSHIGLFSQTAHSHVAEQGNTLVKQFLAPHTYVVASRKASVTCTVPTSWRFYIGRPERANTAIIDLFPASTSASNSAIPCSRAIRTKCRSRRLAMPRPC